MPVLPLTMSEVRIMLLGEDVPLTNRVGNFILGRSAFQTKVLSSEKLHCERASVQLEGRNIIIINTPHLYNPQLSQEELTQRVKEFSLADPGPHVFLLVLQSGTLAHERHDRVRHTLETYCPLSRERSIVITTGEDHGFISECEVRHHRIHDIGIFDRGQVHQLLKKINELMKATGGRDLQERKHTGRLRRHHDRLPKNTAISVKDTIKEKKEENKVSELRVMLLGKSNLDTSHVGNIILGRSVFETEDPQHRAVRCERVSRHVNGQYITLINASHLFHQTLSNDKLTECVKECVSLSAPGLHVIMLIVHPESFTEEEKRRMDDILSFLSDESHKYTMVVTTKHIELGSSVDQIEENVIEKIIAECNNRHLELGECRQADLVKMMEEMVKVNKRSLICKMFEAADPTESQKLSEQITSQLEPQQKEKLEEHMRTEIPGTNLKSLAKRTFDGMKGIGLKKSAGRKQHSESTRTPHMKIVLLGMEEVKASISKLLLGENPQLVETASSLLCVKQGDVCEHLLTLVEMPALCNTQQSEQEVMHLTHQCVSVCDPGVHAFLIAVPEASLTDENKADIEIFQRIFGSRVNYHTIFIINQQSQKQQLDGTLQSVIKSCGGQYEFYSRRTDAKQLITYVTKILKKNNCQYTMAMYFNAQVETQLQYKREIENLQQQITELKMSKDLFQNPVTLRIVLLGKTGVGKSATGNTILGGNLFKEILSAQSVTSVCQKMTGEACGRQIAVIDTPGLFDTNIDNDEIRKEIIKCISMAAPGPHVFLLVLKIGQRFTQEEREAVKIIEKTFGKKSNMYTLVLFTRGDDLKGMQIEQYIETAGANLNTLLYTCGNRYHVFNNNDKSSHTQVLTLLDKIDSMVKVNGGSCYTNEMFQEVEGTLEEEKERILKEREEQIEREKQELKKKHEAEMEEMRREMQNQKERQEAEERRKEEEFKEREEQIKREMAKKNEDLREDFRKRKEEDDLKMEEMNREREESRKQWERQREEDQKQRDLAEDEERKRMEQEWKEQQREEEEKFKKEKEVIKKNKDKELKKLEHECKQKAAEEEKRRRDLEEKIKDAEESKKKELQDLQLSQQRDWERRMREEEEKRKEQEKNWEKRIAEMEEKWSLDQSRKQNQYDRERQKEKEERELKEKERKEKEEQEKKIIENDFNERIRKMEEQLNLQREEDEKERKKKDEEHRKEMEEKLQKQHEEFRTEKEEEERKHNEETERNLAFIRDQHNRELEKLKRETEAAARKQAEEEFTAELDKRVKEAKEATRKQAEEEFTAELDKRVKEAKEAGLKEGRETVESERTLAGRGLDRIFNSFFPLEERKKEKAMKT